MLEISILLSMQLQQAGPPKKTKPRQLQVISLRTFESVSTYYNSRVVVHLVLFPYILEYIRISMVAG